MDSPGIEPGASRMLSGCDTTTPTALRIQGRQGHQCCSTTQSTARLKQSAMHISMIIHCRWLMRFVQTQMRTPGVEPGAQAWEACMLPLHYVRLKWDCAWFLLRHNFCSLCSTTSCIKKATCVHALKKGVPVARNCSKVNGSNNLSPNLEAMNRSYTFCEVNDNASLA